MDRRIVLFDPSEINGAMLYGRGLSTDIHPITAFSGLSEEQKKETLELALGEGDGVMLVGGNAFKWLREYIHFGVRGENYMDCSKLYRLSLEGGSFAKCCPGLPEKKDVEEFMSLEFTKKVDFSWFKWKCISTMKEAWRFMDWLESLPEDENVGCDFETSGMTRDIWFEVSGLSFCNLKFGGFISFTDLRHNSSKEEYYALFDRIGKYVMRKGDHLWAYNMAYEYQVFHRLFNISPINLSDMSVINYLRGDHMKPYSLKWTVQKVLMAEAYDTDFDRISDLIDNMFFVEVGRLKAEKHKELKIDPTTYKDTPEWAEICKRYPNEIPEFERLIGEYWDKSSFMVIPSSILAKYCCLDSFYGLLCVESEIGNYTKTAVDTFLDNIRITCQLHSAGINRDEDFRLQYEKYCKQQMAWGITYSATARSYIKMDKHRKKMANINRYNPVATKLLRDNSFFNGNTIEIAKYLLSGNIDTMDTNELGLDTGSLMVKYGEDFAVDFENMLREGMVDVGMIKTDRKGITTIREKLGEKDVSRKKKLLEIIGGKLLVYLGLDKMKLGEKHIELEKYLYYERAYNELVKISQTQLNDINNIPDEIHAFGKTWNLLDYSTYISTNLFYCTSPQENDELCLEFAQLYPSESSYLAAILECVQQLPGADKYYQNRGINTVDDAFNDFMEWWEKVLCKGVPVDQTPYPLKMYQLSTEFYNNLGCDQVKEIWSNFNGYIAQEQFFKHVTDQYEEYCKPFQPTDLDNRLFFMRKMVLMYLSYKKYAKCLSTYILGMFNQQEWVVEDPKDHVILRKAYPNEPGAVQKILSSFQCMQKSSKRFSSPWHTVISHSDIKSIIHSYPGCLLSYFDISSAEIRTAAAQSKDEGLQGKFEKGEDVYIACGKIYMGEDGWNALSDKDKKKWRKAMKSTLLGILYGLGKNSLAERINTTPEEAGRIIETVFKTYPRLKPYIESQQAYPFSHEGRVNTMFGDILVPAEWKYYLEAPTQREKKNQEARIKRLAVNLPIK